MANLYNIKLLFSIYLVLGFRGIQGCTSDNELVGRDQHRSKVKVYSILTTDRTGYMFFHAVVGNV